MFAGFHAAYVAYITTVVKRIVAVDLNDTPSASGLTLRMMQSTGSIKRKLPQRIHFLAEWAARRGLSQADIARETGADKGTVSRWFAGSLPEQPYVLKIVGALKLKSANDMFRDPDDILLKDFMHGRSEEERKRIMNTLKTAFPPISGGED
jgi:transcriptional regulator with XRE-family HTH domain